MYDPATLQYDKSNAIKIKATPSKMHLVIPGVDGILLLAKIVRGSLEFKVHLGLLQRPPPALGEQEHYFCTTVNLNLGAYRHNESDIIYFFNLFL